MVWYCCVRRFSIHLVVYYCHLLLILFFFFKQKTAYEMRISDWSSDVCSSDLNDRRRETRVAVAMDTRARHAPLGKNLTGVKDRACRRGYCIGGPDYADRKSTRLKSRY